MVNRMVMMIALMRCAEMRRGALRIAHAAVSIMEQRNILVLGRPLLTRRDRRQRRRRLAVLWIAGVLAFLNIGGATVIGQGRVAAVPLVGLDAPAAAPRRANDFGDPFVAPFNGAEDGAARLDEVVGDGEEDGAKGGPERKHDHRQHVLLVEHLVLAQRVPVDLIR